MFNIFSLKNLSFSQNSQITGSTVIQDSNSVIPRGVPKIYGQELNIRYDDVNEYDQNKANKVITFLGNFDRAITLTGNDLDRYVKIASQISCEYCCGASSIIFTYDDINRIEQQVNAAIAAGKITTQEAAQYRRTAGEAACGCAHSFAMRGLAKYLIKNHKDEFMDDEILEELAKWKTLFFPSQMSAKAQVLKQNGIEFSYINLGSNKYRGIEQGQAGSGMVGGC